MTKGSLRLYPPSYRLMEPTYYAFKRMGFAVLPGKRWKERKRTIASDAHIGSGW